MLKLYLSGIIFTTILALVSFLMVVNFISPENAGNFLLTLVFLSLFIGLSGIFTIVGFFVRYRTQRNRMPLRLLIISFRQGVMLGLLLTGSLFLKGQKLYWWWSGLTLLILVIAAESLFLKKQP
jgi:hypothetical protein